MAAAPTPTEVSVRNARNVLTRIVENNNRLPQPDEMAELISIDCDLELKYKSNCVSVLLQNFQGKLSNVRSACTMLRNKMRQLLLPREDRSLDWSVMKASYLRSVPNAAKLLEKIGFVLSGENFVYNDEHPKSLSITDFLVDISMITEELTLYLSGQHSRMDAFKAYLSPAGQQQVSVYTVQKPSNSLLIVRDSELPAPVVPSGIQRNRRTVTLTHPPPPLEPKEHTNQQPSQQSSQQHTQKQPPAPAEPIQMMCDLCGDEPVALVCINDACPRRHLCLGCDQRWHGHPSRRGHQREGADTVVELRRSTPSSTIASAVATLPRPKTALEPAGSGIGPRLVMASSGKNSVSYVSQLELASTNLRQSQSEKQQSDSEDQCESSLKAAHQLKERRRNEEPKNIDSEEQLHKQEEQTRREEREEQPRTKIDEPSDKNKQEEPQDPELSKQQTQEEEKKMDQHTESNTSEEQQHQMLQFEAIDIAGGFNSTDTGSFEFKSWDSNGFATMPARQAAPDFSRENDLGDSLQHYRQNLAQTLESESQGRSQNLERHREGLNRITRVEASLDLRQDDLLTYIKMLDVHLHSTEQATCVAAPESTGFKTLSPSPSPPPRPLAANSQEPPVPLIDEGDDGSDSGRCAEESHTPRATPPPHVAPQLTSSVPASLVGEDATEPKWTCPNCTVEIFRRELKVIEASNRAVCPVCSMSAELDKEAEVNTVPAAVGEATVAFSTSWDCPACTFVNADCNHCQICGNRRSSPSPVAPSAPPAPSGAEPSSAISDRTSRLLDLLRRADSNDRQEKIADARLIAAALVAAGDSEISDDQLVTWLREEWPRRVERVRLEATRRFLADRPDLQPHVLKVLAFSEREVSEAMADCPHLSETDCLPAVQYQCAMRREQAVCELAQLYPNFSVRDLHAAVAKADGSLEKALDRLNGQVLNTYLCELSQAEDQSNADAAESVTFDGSQFSLHILMVEHGLRSETIARRLTKLHNHEDFGHYQLEDLVEAVKNTDATLDDESWLQEVSAYMNKVCPICTEKFPRHNFLAMLYCGCELCQECFHGFVTTNMKDMHVTHLNCPVCRYPKANDVEELQGHFQHMLAQIAHFQHPTLRFDADDFNRLQDRLFDWQTMRNPDFVWCSHCGVGFELVAEDGQTRFACPRCRKETCRLCRKPWEKQHKGLSCEQFERWKQENDPEFQSRGVAFYLQQHGIECPSCHFKYALAGGGCLHFVCRMCRANFCSGCGNLFQHNESHGLVCQHPRSCLYHLRDFDIDRLQQLLRQHRVEIRSDVPTEDEVDECKVMEQKETAEGLVDEPCSRRVLPGRANLCDKHYSEYLVTLINRNKLDPVEIMDRHELLAVCRRHGIALRSTEVSDADLRKAILAKCPL